jgi:hypothetical protein
VKGFTYSRRAIQVRGVIGGFFVLFGLVIAGQILYKIGLDWRAVPGVALAAAMIALGVVRIRAALTLPKDPP